MYSILVKKKNKHLRTHSFECLPRQNMNLRNVMSPMMGSLREGLSQAILFITFLEGKFIFQKSVAPQVLFSFSRCAMHMHTSRWPREHTETRVMGQPSGPLYRWVEQLCENWLSTHTSVCMLVSTDWTVFLLILKLETINKIVSWHPVTNIPFF